MTIGVYRIIHVESGKCYVGQSVRIEYRLSQHLRGLLGGVHPNEYLQRAYSLHGDDAFVAEILEVCSQKTLTEREQFWMDFYRPTGLYNLTPAAGSTAGYKFTEEQSENLSKSLKGNTKLSESIAVAMLGNQNGKGNKGKKRSDESRALMSVAAKGRKFKPRSEDHRKNLSEAGKLAWQKRKAASE